jgi:hypothetical protein
MSDHWTEMQLLESDARDMLKDEMATWPVCMDEGHPMPPGSLDCPTCHDIYVAWASRLSPIQAASVRRMFEEV